MDLSGLGYLAEESFFSKRPINQNQNSQEKTNSWNKTLTRDRGKYNFLWNKKGEGGEEEKLKYIFVCFLTLSWKLFRLGSPPQDYCCQSVVWFLPLPSLSTKSILLSSKSFKKQTPEATHVLRPTYHCGFWFPRIWRSLNNFSPLQPQLTWVKKASSTFIFTISRIET